MEYNIFGIKLTTRIVLIIANSLLFAFVIISIPEKKIYFIPLILAALLVYQIWELNRFINYTNIEISRFINSLKTKDLSAKFLKRNLNSSFSNLFNEMQNLLYDIKNEKIKNEAVNYFRDEIIKHLAFGIITVNDNDEITLINVPALNLIGKQSVQKFSEIVESKPEIAKEIKALYPKGEKLIELSDENGIHSLLLSVSTIVILGTKMMIISFQDIRKEIDQKEVDAWIKLIRVIRHEIMNSATPISSMSETIVMVLEDNFGNPKSARDFTDEDIVDLHSSAKTIRQRTEGLYRFAEKYWDISKIPHLKKKRTTITELVDPVYNLILNETKQKGIDLVIEHKNINHEIEADITLIQQVLINLVKNSIEALQGISNSKVIIRSYFDKNKTIIDVVDNGPGIQQNLLDEIFVPFFTTKKVGSGIGLSLSKQIMNLHGGSIAVYSTPNVETTFRLTI